LVEGFGELRGIGSRAKAAPGRRTPKWNC